MLELLAPNSRLDPSLLDREGTFAWWYLDLVDRDGDGLVLIWAFGLPFLPGIGVARDRPSIALSVYRDGKAEFVLLSEIEEAAVTDDGWLFDGCLFTERTVGDERLLDVVLDLPTCSGPLRGTVSARGRVLEGVGREGDHGWTPQMGAGPGEASLRCADWSCHLEGAAYRDRNEGRRRLDGLGISHWTWGRTTLQGRLVCWYLVQGEQPGAHVFVETEGRLNAVPVTVEESGLVRDRYGLTWASALRLTGPGVDLLVHQDPPVDRGPFYLRHPVHAWMNGASGRGWGERVRPDRITMPWMRPLIEMRIQRTARNSPLLPFFSGPLPRLGWL